MNEFFSSRFMRDIQAFHTKFGQRYDGPPRSFPDMDMAEFRTRFLQEEKDEFTAAALELARYVALDENPTDEAFITDRLEHMLDGLVDLVVSACGGAWLVHGCQSSLLNRPSRHMKMIC